MKTNGIYQIVGVNGDIWSVYCDFTSEPGSAWAFNKGFIDNSPVNEMTPNWTVYRMSKEQMSFFRAKSTHWRATCSFDQIEVDYRDYMRGNFEDVDIITLQSTWQCHNMEYINILGNE